MSEFQKLFFKSKFLKLYGRFPPQPVRTQAEMPKSEDLKYRI